MIDAIGEVEYTDDSKELIDAARNAYDALEDAQKAYVTKLDVLEAAEDAYEALKPTEPVGSKYAGYEYVLTADKTSVATGEKVILTVTANGPLANASAVQFQIDYFADEFTTTKVVGTAFDKDWYADIKDGSGLGAIARPKIGNKANPDDAAKMIFSVAYLDTDLENGYAMFVGEDSDIYEATSTVAAKVIFTAKKDIADIANSFTLSGAKNAFGDENGQLGDKQYYEGTYVQLGDSNILTVDPAEIYEIDTWVDDEPLE